MVETRHGVAGRVDRRRARRGCAGAADEVHPRSLLRRLFDQCADRGSRGWEGDGCVALCRRAARGGTWWTGPPARAASLFMEIGEMGEWRAVHGAGRSGFLGAPRIPHVRRPMARAALLR